MPLLYLILASISFSAPCPNQKQSLGPYRFLRSEISVNLGCVVNVNITNDEKPIRAFNFFKDGQILIQSQLSTVRHSADVGTRTYFILPAGEIPDIQTRGQTVQIKDSAGMSWNFDKTGRVSNFQCQLSITPEVSWASESTENGSPGGFQIKKCPGSIVVDVGFKRGGDPTMEKNRKSTIRDQSGHSCEIKNSELFNYPTKWDSKFRYTQPQDFYQFLSRKSGCEELDLSPLQRGRQKSSNQRDQR